MIIYVANRIKLIPILILAIVLGSVILTMVSDNNEYDMEKVLVNNSYNVNLPEGQKTPENTVINDGSQRYYFNKRNADQAYDCSTDELGCVPFQPNQTYLECEEVYTPKKSMENYCYTTNDTSTVTLKTDERLNHITAPITNEKLNVTTHDQLLGENFEFGRPWDLEFINDDRYLVSGLNGHLFDVKDGDIKIYKIDVQERGPENSWQTNPYTGLMGVTAHPNFTENQQVYLHYSYDKTYNTREPFVLNKVSRFQLDRENQSMSKLDTVIDEIPGRNYYHGGRMKFGPENEYLYITTGAAIYEWAQNTSFLGGKILRLKPDGSIPSDNPYGNEIYAKGFRNPQGIEFNPETETMFTSQHGPMRKDNIAKVGRGANLGWPNHCERSDPNAEIGEEVFCAQTWTLAPSGMAFVDDKSHPWYNDLFIASLRGNQVHRISFDGSEVTGNEIFWFNGFQAEPYENKANRIRDVEFKNNSLWVLHDDSYITKIEPR